MVAQATEESEELQKSEVSPSPNVAVYTFNYPSVTATGEPVMLSALLMAWSPTEPYGNYLSFRDAHPDGEGTLYKIDDNSFSDHVDQGTMFFMYLALVGEYGSYYKWLDEPYTPTGIQFSHYTPITSPLWYTLDGRQLNGKPTTKGIYINNGRKIAIK